MDLLLIHPPAAKPAEPPLGTAVLLGRLREEGFEAEAVDANLEAYLYLLDPERIGGAAGPRPPTALRRAVAHAPRALARLRDPRVLGDFPRYAAAVRTLNGALSAWRGEDGAERLSLSDYRHGGASEFSPDDLRRVAAGETATLFDGYFRDVLVPRAARLSPRAVGITVNYRHQMIPAFAMAGRLREALPGVPVVGGGGMFSSLAGDLRSGRFDAGPFAGIGLGPGEGLLAGLAASGAWGEPRVRSRPVPPAFRPDYGFAPPRDYLSPVPVVPVASSRGCYWRRCLFCPEAAAPTQPYAALDPVRLPALLLELGARHGTSYFHLADDAIPVPALAALASARRELKGLSWHGFLRFEPALLDPVLVRDLAASGLVTAHLGLESGSQRVLDRLGKGTRLAEASAILRNLGAAGIGAYVYVMVGTPGESEEECEETLRFLERHGDAVTGLNLAVMNLPRASALGRDGGRDGARSGESGESGEAVMRGEPGREGGGGAGLYRPVPATGGWDRASARRFLDRRLLRSPAIRRIVRRTPPFFTSNHAFLFEGRRR